MATTTQDSIAPGLLIAMPQLRDPNFKRMVVLMLEHNEEGSFGVVINNPVSAEVTIQSESGDPIPIEENIYLGGPVSPHVCMVIHSSVWHKERTQEIVEGLSVSEPSQTVPHLLGTDDIPYRFIMGYAGWGPGQLSTELSRGAWLCSPATAHLVLEVDPEDQWNQAIRALGIDPMMLVPATRTQ